MNLTGKVATAVNGLELSPLVRAYLQHTDYQIYISMHLIEMSNGLRMLLSKYHGCRVEVDGILPFPVNTPKGQVDIPLYTEEVVAACNPASQTDIGMIFPPTLKGQTCFSIADFHYLGPGHHL